MSYFREHRHLIKEYTARGWVVELTKGHHVRWRSPSGRLIFASSTPSDHRAHKNFMALLKKSEEPPTPGYKH